MTYPSSRPAGSAKCFASALQEAFMSLSYAATQVDAVVIVICTIGTDFVTYPPRRLAGSAECFTSVFQEALMAFCFTATQMNAVAAIIGTVWMMVINHFTRPGRLVSWGIMFMYSRSAAWSAACPEVVFLIAFHAGINATTGARTILIAASTTACVDNAKKPQRQNREECRQHCGARN
jgi:uncharacterized membrane protein